MRGRNGSKMPIYLFGDKIVFKLVHSAMTPLASIACMEETDFVIIYYIPIMTESYYREIEHINSVDRLAVPES